MKVFLKFSCTLLMVALAACNGTQDLGPDKTGQSFVVKGHSYNEVWEASLEAVQFNQDDRTLEVDRTPQITKRDKEAGIIYASAGMGFWTWGEAIGVFILPAHNAPSYRIDVESRAKYKLNVTDHNWENQIIAAIKNNLARSKSQQK